MKRNEFYKKHVRNYIAYRSWGHLSGKSVLIAGACGMIGSALVDMLLSADETFGLGLQVYALGRDERHARQRFSEYIGKGNFGFVAGDVTACIEFPYRADFIVHAANSAYPEAYRTDPIGVMRANFDGTYHLLQIASSQKARLVFLSSGEIYGETDSMVKTENDYGYVDSMDVRSCYPNSKRAAETLCVAHGHQYGTDSVIVRPSHVYGPTMTQRDNRAVSDFLKHGLSGQDIVMKGNGEAVRTYTYVFDVCLGILVAMEKGKTLEAYNIADRKSMVSIKELADIISGKCGVRVVQNSSASAREAGFTSIQRQVMSADKLSALGWDCYSDIRSGIDYTLQSLSHETGCKSS